MLLLSREPGQSLAIYPDPGVNPDTPVAVLFEHGSIRMQVVDVRGQRVCLGVAAPAGLGIVRDACPPTGEGEAPGYTPNSARKGAPEWTHPHASCSSSTMN